jgi:uncharacterized Zn finger protein
MKRGEQIIQEGSLVLQHIEQNNISAYAFGTSIYHVILSRKNNILTGTCTCPAFIDFGPCKHMAAAGLARLTPGYQPDELYWKQKENFEHILRFLEKQSKDKLVHIIMQCIGQHPEMLDLFENDEHIYSQRTM